MYCENCGVFFEQAANFCRVCGKGKNVRRFAMKYFKLIEYLFRPSQIIKSISAVNIYFIEDC